MNKLLLKTLLVSAVLVGSGAAVAAHDPVLAEKMKLCFEMHGKLMSMRTFKGVYDCYRTHAYLMDKQA